MVDVIPRRPRRVAAKRVDSFEGEKELERTLEGSWQENTHKAGAEEEEEEETEKKPPIVQGGPNLPKYLHNVLCAD
ncbi:unnamed protein product [Calypogeia fissa]